MERAGEEVRYLRRGLRVGLQRHHRTAVAGGADSGGVIGRTGPGLVGGPCQHGAAHGLRRGSPVRLLGGGLVSGLPGLTRTGTGSGDGGGGAVDRGPECHPGARADGGPHRRRPRLRHHMAEPGAGSRLLGGQRRRLLHRRLHPVGRLRRRTPARLGCPLHGAVQSGSACAAHRRAAPTSPRAARRTGRRLGPGPPHRGAGAGELCTGACRHALRASVRRCHL